MAKSLFTESYVQNSCKIEYLGTCAADSNDCSLIREPLMSFKLYNFDFSDSMTGVVCIALWRCQFKFKLAAPRDFFFLKGALNSGIGH